MLRIKNYDFIVVTHGTAYVPHSPGVLAVAKRYANGQDAEVLDAEPTADLHESVRACIAEGRLNSALKQHSGPGRAVHLALKITASREEAEDFCIRILPFAEGLKRVKALTLQVVKRQIALEQARIRQREHLAAVALQVDILKVGQQLAAMRHRHSARR